MIETLVAQFGRGMTADVTSTTELVGRYYVTNHDYITLGQFTAPSVHGI